MITAVLTLLAPALAVAMLVLTLILAKGDICPGQRGRIHKLLPAIGILWLAIASLKVEAFLVVFAIFYFYSKVQTGKTRQQGPFWVLHLANGLAGSFAAIIVVQQPNLAQSLSLACAGLLLGTAFSHLLLTIAKTRLQAFHRILPVAGVVFAMLLALSFVFNAYQWEPNIVAEYTPAVISSLVMLMLGVVIWSWHIIKHSAPAKGQLVVAFLSLMVTNVGLLQLYWLA
ncbi:hypothetical protein J4N45_06025 [Vibrio sp. SCSIO 43140]|uniref:hypothetical protein n=1 Tax=Vibrio sp. SCSIO 43140 TaxID=2819100 RepID=UPI0020763CCB|nr:hypothetical protein [Vibrio sp. SCSIO 43140]USD61521.1 hypothetical protein J4N45_06025 [Vibrio sp. SCSIO 43140]